VKSPNLLGPKIDATFSRVAMSEFDLRRSPVAREKNQGNHPQPDRDAAVGRDGGKNIQVENGDDKKKNEVPFAQNPAQVGRFLCARHCSDLVRQVSSLVNVLLRKVSDRLHLHCEASLLLRLRKRRRDLFETPLDACRCQHPYAGRDSPLLVPPVRLREHAAIDHGEPVVAPEIDVDFRPVTVVLNLFRIEHQRTVDTGAGDVGLQPDFLTMAR